MNKRQKKKRAKIVSERLKYYNDNIYFYVSGRRNGKTFLYKTMLHAVLSKRYKPFKDLKKYIDKTYNKAIISVDYSNGRDYTCIIHAHRDKGKVTIRKIETIEEK